MPRHTNIENPLDAARDACQGQLSLQQEQMHLMDDGETGLLGLVVGKAVALVCVATSILQTVLRHKIPLGAVIVVETPTQRSASSSAAVGRATYPKDSSPEPPSSLCDATSSLSLGRSGTGGRAEGDTTMVEGGPPGSGSLIARQCCIHAMNSLNQRSGADRAGVRVVISLD